MTEREMNDISFKLVAPGAGYAEESEWLPRGNGTVVSGKNTTPEARVMPKVGGKGTDVL